MSGVIDEHGQQWEHCNHCNSWVRIQDLEYGPSPKHPDESNVDLCHPCYVEHAMTPWERAQHYAGHTYEPGTWLHRLWANELLFEELENP